MDAKLDGVAFTSTDTEYRLDCSCGWGISIDRPNLETVQAEMNGHNAYHLDQRMRQLSANVHIPYRALTPNQVPGPYQPITRGERRRHPGAWNRLSYGDST